MSRQYNMYNVQLSEFWKQRCGKETMHNAPYMFEADEVSEYAESEAPSRISSRAATSVASTATRQKVGAIDRAQPHDVRPLPCFGHDCASR